MRSNEARGIVDDYNLDATNLLSNNGSDTAINIFLFLLLIIVLFIVFYSVYKYLRKNKSLFNFINLLMKYFFSFKNFLITNKKKIIISVIIILILGIPFYWFQYRPSSIRKYCAKEYLGSRHYYFVSEESEKKYFNCLRAHGMKE